MNELKTLENWDVNCKAIETDDWYQDRKQVIKELRKEAIKWIKDIRKTRQPHPIDRLVNIKISPEVKQMMVQTKIDWIIHFFNLTEEQLKWFLK